MNQYETVFILTPVLSDVQMKEAVEKFKGILTAEGAEICLLYTSPSPRDGATSRMPSSA